MEERISKTENEPWALRRMLSLVSQSLESKSHGLLFVLYL